jgi:hypothetical protein
MTLYGGDCPGAFAGIFTGALDGGGTGRTRAQPFRYKNTSVQAAIIKKGDTLFCLFIKIQIRSRLSICDFFH